MNWILFFAVLLAPPLLTMISVLIFDDKTGVAPVLALVGSLLAGAICGAMLGRRLGKTLSAQAILGVVFGVALAATCLGASCVGCLAGGYKFNLH